jgi:O-antigen/teichoic acid export membrane protein
MARGPTPPDSDSAATAHREAGERAVRNTVARATGEILGSLASLVLFGALGRATGPAGLGVYVFAIAWVEIATMPTGIGLDRYFLRRVAADRSRREELVNVMALKLTLAVPIVLISLTAVGLLGYPAQTRTVIYLLTPGLLMDALARSHFSVFTAYERSELQALTVVVQRFARAGIGLAALALGFGVVTVAGAYTVGAAIALVVAIRLRRRYVGSVPFAVSPRDWRALASRSLPFGVQDVFGVLLARLDAVMLSILATEAAVGRYGAAYRLMESTFIITSAIVGAFAAMFTYLTHDSEPRVGAVFQRSIKLCLAVMVPLAVSFAIVPRQILHLVFGAELAQAAPTLRLLSPVVLLFSVVYISSALVVSRGRPNVMVAVAGATVLVNAALNLALIPTYADRGAAAAMLGTEMLAMPVALTIAVRLAGGIHWARTVAGPLLAGAAMSAPMLLLGDSLVVAIVAGGVAYLASLAALERLISPVDFEFVGAMIRRRLPAWGAE